MPWVRFDDQFASHRKVTRLSDAAFRLHVSAVFWCARNLTDGAVPEVDVENVCARVRSPQKFVTELVRQGLWHETGAVCDSPDCPAHPDNAGSNAVTANGETGWLIHDYLEYQPSKARVERERESNASRQKRWREQQKNRNAVTNGGSNAVSNSAPARPVPTRPVEGGLGEGESPTERAGDPPPPTLHTGPRPADRCDRHAGVDDPPACGQCADARRAAEAWDAEQPRRDAAARSAEARRRAELRAAEIAACRMCDSHGYAGARVCDHDPQRADVAARGSAAVRAALAERRTA